MPPPIRPCPISCPILGIPVAQPLTPRNLEPRPDLVVIGNAMSRGNVELEYVLDQSIPFCSLPQLLHDEFLKAKKCWLLRERMARPRLRRCSRGSFTLRGLDPPS